MVTEGKLTQHKRKPWQQQEDRTHNFQEGKVLHKDVGEKMGFQLKKGIGAEKQMLLGELGKPNCRLSFRCYCTNLKFPGLRDDECRMMRDGLSSQDPCRSTGNESSE